LLASLFFGPPSTLLRLFLSLVVFPLFDTTPRENPRGVHKGSFSDRVPFFFPAGAHPYLDLDGGFNVLVSLVFPFFPTAALDYRLPCPLRWCSTCERFFSPLNTTRSCKHCPRFLLVVAPPIPPSLTSFRDTPFIPCNPSLAN